MYRALDILTAGCVVFRNNNVLLVRHISGKEHIIGTYGIPAGRVETNSTMEDLNKRGDRD